jgi:uncharacterized protein YukE
MSVIPDLHSLDTTATRIDQHATELRSRANDLDAACASVRWQSGAATEFRVRSERTCGQLRQTAERLDHASAVLRRHAATARDELAIAASVVGVGASLLDDVLSGTGL